MAITGISSIDNKQIIAAGALSAISANQALVTSGGDSLQGLYDTVSTNSGSWTGGGGGGSVTSPSGTIIVNGSNIEATNSAVGTIVTPSASALLGNNVRINGPWDPSPSVYNFTLPTSGGTLYAVRTTWYGSDTLNFSGKDLNGNIITTGTMTVGGNPGTYTADLNEIVSDLSAQGVQNDVRMEQFYVTSPSASNSGVYELAWKKDVPTGQFFTGYNTLSTGGITYKAAIDTDVRLSAGNNTYSLTGIYSKVNNLETAFNYSRTIMVGDGNSYEMGNKAYKTDIVGLSGATDFQIHPNSFYIRFELSQYPPITAKLDTVYLTFEATQSGTVISTGWNLYSHSGNEYTFVRYLKPTSDIRPSYEYSFDFDYGSFGTITNATASATVYSAYEIKELAFKDDLTGGSVPDEVMSAASAVSANSADWNSTTDTVSSNSGVWGGSALPISAGPGIKVNLVDNTLVFSNDETVLYTANAASNTIVLSEKATNFERLRLELQSYQSTMVVNYTEVKPNDNYLTFFAQTLIPAATYPLQILGVQFSSTNGITYNMSRGVRAYYKVTSDWGGNDNTDMTSSIKDAGFITKIVGINRKQ